MYDLDTACYKFAAVENPTKKKVTAHAVSLVHGGGGLGTRQKKKEAKISPTFCTFTGLLRLNEGRVPVALGVRRRFVRAADKLRTDRHYCFILSLS